MTTIERLKVRIERTKIVVATTVDDYQPLEDPPQYIKENQLAIMQALVELLEKADRPVTQS